MINLIKVVKYRGVVLAFAMYNHLLFFSSWIPITSIELGKYYLDIIDTFFNNENIYHGCNYGCCVNWHDILRQKYKNVFIDTNKDSINSDVPGFMQCLRNYKFGENDYIWFAHTKGASYSNLDMSKNFRNYLEMNFWNKQKDVENIFNNNEHIGTIATDYIIHSNKNIQNELNKWASFSYSCMDGFFIPNTFYIMRSDIVNKFLNECTEYFLSGNFNNPDNRYIFEAYFCAISERYGYIPYFLNNNNEFFPYIEKWKSYNCL